MSVDYPDWSVPQQNANAISTTGVPLLRGTNSLGGGNLVTVPANSAVTLITTVNVTQPGYEGMFILNLPAGVGSNPFARVSFTWIDSISLQNISFRTMLLSAGNGPANALTYYIAGPVHGDQLNLVINNLDTTQDMTLTWQVNQTSHIYQHDSLRQFAYLPTAPIGFTNPDGAPGGGVLLITRPTIAASGQSDRLVAVFAGKAMLGIDNAGGSAVIWVSIHDPNLLYSPGNSVRMEPVVAANGANAVVPVFLPYGPVLVRIENKSTTASVTPTVTLVSADY